MRRKREGRGGEEEHVNEEEEEENKEDSMCLCAYVFNDHVPYSGKCLRTQIFVNLSNFCQNEIFTFFFLLK